MADKAKLTIGENDYEYPILSGTVGPDVIDIRKLYAQTGSSPTIRASPRPRAARAQITYIDGDKGILLHRGYPIDQLAENSTFMEVSYLLLNGELPTKEELHEVHLHDHAPHHAARAARDFYRGFRRDAHPMAIMCGVVGALSAFYHDSTDITDPAAAADRLAPADRQDADDRGDGL